MGASTYIHIAPNNPAMINGENLTFTLTYDGDAPTGIKWFVDDVEQSGETSATFVYTPVYTATNTTHIVKATTTTPALTSETETVVVINVGYYYYHMLVDLDAIKKAVE